MGTFKQTFFNRMKSKLKGGVDSLKESAKNKINESGEFIGNRTADWVIEASDDVVTELKKDAAPIIENTAKSLSLEQTDSWMIIREQIAPSGGFFNTLFARLLWVGSKVGSFVGALVVDSWTGNNDKDKNTGNLEVIFAWMLGGMFKKEKTATA